MLKITLAKPKDIKELTTLLNLLFEQEKDFIPDTKKQIKGLEMIINTPEMGCIIKLEVDGQTVGMINLLFSISTALGGKVGIIEDFIISPKYRGKGYGQKLFAIAIETAKNEGCLRVSLITDSDNAKGQHFYKQQGMVASSMVPFRKMID